MNLLSRSNFITKIENKKKKKEKEKAGSLYLNGEIVMNKGTKQFWSCLRFMICVIMVLGFICQPVTRINASSTTIKQTDPTYPRLFVTKKIEKAEIYIDTEYISRIVLGDTFVVSITINNFGNKTAYNVTFIDSPTSSLVFEIKGLTRILFLEITPNETQQFSYLVTAKAIGLYKLGQAQIDYYTSKINPIKYVAFSNSLTVSVNKPAEDFSITNWNVALTLIIIINFGNIILITRLIAPKLDRRPH